ncbi:MAG: fused MFS/spermidine synthase [Magnetococcales bacterium]|nr:fused MFS/spermidine synthase [Magnetococcales bacterium]
MPFLVRLAAHLYGPTILLGSFLLFLVQPMAGKQILPWFGGASAVWTTCLLFFQVTLLFGYLYAHVGNRRLTLRQQSWLHIALLLLALFLLPLQFVDSRSAGGDEAPIRHILELLAASIGLPYLLLAANSPLLQAWYAAQQQAQPYRLFALSNVGSLLALLGYPTLIEPWLSLDQQLTVWSALFVIHMVLSVVLVAGIQQQGLAAWSTTPAEANTVPHAQRVYWLALALAPSLLLLAVTRFLTTDIAPVPLLWILPLALYLLSFVLAFDHPRWYKRELFIPLLLLALCLMTLLPISSWQWLSLPVVMGAMLLAATILFLACHGELAALRPDPAHLTAFYLTISLGGAVGGAMGALLAPLACNDACELPVAVLLCGLFSLGVALPRLRYSTPRARYLLQSGVAMVLLFAGMHNLSYWLSKDQSVAFLQRNFYGILRVADNAEHGYRKLLHGRILHGVQFLAEEKQDLPTTYYGAKSGAGRLLALLKERGALRVGVIGVGIASLAAYGRAEDSYRFYELDPAVAELARNWFFHLPRLSAHHDMIIGDARRRLAQQPANQFDVLLLDAFAGDAIPVHLLTLEAFTLYQKHLQEKGVLAVHVSNRYLDLARVVQAAAQHLGLSARLLANPGDKNTFEVHSKWVLVSRDSSLWQHPLLAEGKPIPLPAGFQAWTDQHASLWSLMVR